MRLHQLKWLCVSLKKTPAEIALMDSESLRRGVKDLRDRLVAEGKESRARGVMIVSKMFYNVANDLGPSQPNFIRWRRDEVPKYVYKKGEFEHVPTMHEVWQMADSVDSLPVAAGTTRSRHGYVQQGSNLVWASRKGQFLSLRNRALILCLAMTGVRKNCIKRWTYGMVGPCLESTCNHNHPMTEDSIRYPLYLKITNEVDTKLRLYKVPFYYTFLHKDGVAALVDYLDFRKDAEWTPRETSPIFAPDGPLVDSTMSDGAILHVIRQAAQTTASTKVHARGIWRHQLRKTFRMVINRTPTDDDFKVRIMGWRLAGSRKNYANYDNADEDALKYTTADFSRDSEQAYKSVIEKLATQMEIIRILQIEVDALKQKLTALRAKAMESSHT